MGSSTMSVQVSLDAVPGQSESPLMRDAGRNSVVRPSQRLSRLMLGVCSASTAWSTGERSITSSSVSELSDLFFGEIPNKILSFS
jgi:hypothetical protein